MFHLLTLVVLELVSTDSTLQKFLCETRFLFYLATRKLEPIAGYILPQQFYKLDVALCWCLSRLRSCYRTRDQSRTQKRTVLISGTCPASTSVLYDNTGSVPFRS